MAAQDTRRGLIALTCVMILLLSTFASYPIGAAVTSGGNTSASAAGNAPGVSVPDTSIDTSSQSTVEVAYNATGMGISNTDLEVVLLNSSSNMVIATNDSLPSTKGVADLTIAGGLPASSTGVTAMFVNNTSGARQTIAQDTAFFTVTNSGGGGSATSVTTSQNVSVTDISLNKSTVNESETFELNVTLTNTGGVQETVSVSPMAYEWDNGTNGQSKSWSMDKTVDAQSSVNATFEVNLSSYGGYEIMAGNYDTNPRMKVLASGTNIVLRNVYDSQTVIVNESQLFFVTAKNYGNTAGHGNLSMEWGDGTVLSWYNTSTIAPGASESGGFNHMFTQTGDYDLYFDHDGGKHHMNLTVRERVITDSSYEIVDGPTPNGNANLNVDASFNANQVAVKIQNGSATELDGTGVTRATKFRINVTVKNFTSRVLIGSARNTSWERTPINSTHTNLTIVGTPAEVQYTSSNYNFQNWPDNDQADYSRNLTVDFSAFALDSYAGGGGWAERVNGTLISTDAQMFGTPEFNETANGGTGALELTVAAPHYNVDGTVNDGFYEAQIPQSLLDHWGVSDVSRLGASYKGGSASITATALSGGGAKVSVPLSYSSGTVSIAPTSSGGGGGGGSNANTGSTSQPGVYVDDTDDDDSDETSVSVGASKTTADGTQTASASVKNAKANSTVSLSFDDGSEDASDGDESQADAALEGLNVSLSDDADFDVEVSTSTDAPAEAASTPTPDGSDVASYVQIDHDGLSDDQISAAALTMRVKKDRFGDDFDPANAVVYRLHDGEWTELETTLMGETETHYRFRADSPGLSVFAVGEKKPDLSSSYSLSSTSTQIGEDVTVDVTVANDGAGQGTFTAELTADGDVVQTKTVTVPAGETVTVSLGWEFGAGGDYVLAVNGEEVGTVTVASVDRTTSTTTTQEPTSTDSSTTTSPETTADSPGFGFIAGLLALLGGALLARD